MIELSDKLSDLKWYLISLQILSFQVDIIGKQGLQQKLQYFPRFVQHLSTLTKYLHEHKDKFPLQMMGKLFGYGLSQIIRLKQKYRLQNESQFPQNNEKYNLSQQLILKKKKQSHQSDQIKNYYLSMKKYSDIDLRYKFQLIQQIKSNVLLIQQHNSHVQSKYIIEQFKIIKQLTKKKYFINFDKQILKQLQQLSKKIKKQNKKIFNKLIEIFLQNRDINFLQDHLQIIFNLTINQQIKILLFSTYYKSLQHIHHIFNKSFIINKLITWNIELGIVPVQQFIEKIMDVSYITAQSYSSIIYNSSKLALELKKKLIQIQIKFEINDLFIDQCLAHDVRVYVQCVIKQIYQLTKIQADKFRWKPLTNINVLRNMEIVKKVYEKVNKLIQCAQKNGIYLQDFIYYLSLLSSLIESRRQSQLYKQTILQFYINQIKSIRKNQFLKLGKQILQIYKIFKNSLTLFLIICCCLLGTHGSKQHQKQCIDILTQISHIVAIKDYAKISGYSQQVLKILLLLSFNSNPQIKQQCIQILKQFSLLYKKKDLITILYQYDIKIFQNLTKTLNINFTNKNNQQFIFHVLHLIQHLIAFTIHQKYMVITKSDNCIHFIPIRYANNRNNLTISFQCLINPQICYNSAIQIYCCSQSQQPQTTQKHRILFKYNKIIFQAKQGSNCIQDQQGKMYCKLILFQIKIVSGKLVILVNSKKLIQIDYNYIVYSVLFNLNGDIFITNFKWKKQKNQQKMLQFNSNFQVFPLLAQIKIKKLQSTQIQNFRQKLDMFYFCRYLLQLLKYNHSNINLNQYYSICFSLLYKLHVINKKQLNISQYSYIRQLFISIVKYAKDITTIQLPIFQSKQIKQIQQKKLNKYVINTIFDKKFMIQCSDKSKQKIWNCLNQMFFGKSDYFRHNTEWNNKKTFYNICNIVLNTDGNLRNQYGELIKKLIETHEISILVIKKLYMMYYLADKNSSEYLNSIFNQCISQIFNNQIYKRSQYSSCQQIKKLIISSNNDLQTIFMLTNINEKMQILQYMINNNQLCNNWYKMFQQLQQNCLIQFSAWIIVHCKRLTIDFFDRNIKDIKILKNMIFLLKSICKIYLILKDINQKDQCLIILQQFINKQKFIKSDQIDNYMIQEMHSLYYHSDFIRVIQKMIQGKNSKGSGETKQSLLSIYFDELINRMPKYVILSALKQFRMNVEQMKQNIKYIIKLDSIDNLQFKQYFLSIFLQYLLQSQNNLQCQQLGILINNFMSKLFKHYSGIHTIKQPFFYTFPRLQKQIKLNRQNIVKAKINHISGICFKFICIVFHLMEIIPEFDFSTYFKFFFDVKQNRTINKSGHNIFSIVREKKSRSGMDGLIKELYSQHKGYYEKYDQQISENSKLDYKKAASSTKPENDLTPYFIDFILMKLFLYLQNHCFRQVPQQQLKLLQSYSKLSLSSLKSNPPIYDQMSEKNIQQIKTYQDVKDLTNLLQNYQQQTISQMMLSPGPNCKRLNQYRSQGFIPLQKSNQHQYYYSPDKKNIKNITLELISNKKQKFKSSIINHCQHNLYQWCQQAKSKYFHRFFKCQSKQILFFQILHQLYIVSTSADCSRQKQSLYNKKLQKFLQTQQKTLVQQKKQSTKTTHPLPNTTTHQIRLVKNYTCSFDQQYELQCQSITNDTFPFITLLKNKKIKSHNSCPSIIINDDIIINISYVDSEKHITLTTQDYRKKKYGALNCNICEISTRKGVYFCQWQINQKQNCVIFTTKNQKIPPLNSSQRVKRIMKYGSPICNIISGEGKQILLKSQQIHQIYLRKYNQIKNNSIQFFFKNGKSLFIIFYVQQLVQQFIKLCKQKLKQFINIKYIDDCHREFYKQNFIDQWINGQISNFQYLMIVNKYAGRSFNDLNQYYVFPWIIQQYSKQFIDISKKESFRDLQKPIGALNQEKLKKFIQKFNSQSMQKEERYLYGSHYSVSLFLCYYMVRLQPFTSLHKDMQSGVFDSPDRLFHSIEQMWNCIMNQSSTSDIKQSIPQFYYFPLFLKNINKLELGERETDHLMVDDVILPQWANSATHFIQTMRVCLESDYVSSNLHHWIDLIFGKFQRSRQKTNLFHPLSYMQSIIQQSYSLQNLDAIMNQITFFGQCPSILFDKQHQKKNRRHNNSSLNVNMNMNSPQKIPQKLKASINSMRSVNEQQKKQQRKQQKKQQKINVNIGTQTLQSINYVHDIKLKDKKIVQMIILSISKNDYKKIIQLNMENSIRTLIRTLQKSEIKVQTKKHLIINPTQTPLEKVQVTHRITDNEIIFNIGTKDVNQIIKIMHINYKFNHLVFNQIVFVLYGGGPGLRVYNWNEELIWEYSCQAGEISECFLQHGILFFATSAGKLFLYDFFLCRNQLVFQFQKSTFSVKMVVYPQNKCISGKNKNYYKILLVGDLRKIVLIDYVHKVGRKINSLE